MADHNPSQITPTSPSEAPTKTFISDKELHHENPNDHHRQDETEVVDYAQRAQWLRAAILGANDGLVSTASLMMGVGAVRKDVKTMILTGVAGMVAGACSMGIGEFVSVYSQYDIEVAQLKRQGKEVKKAELPNPYYAAVASAVAFAMGAVVPLLGAAFIKDYMLRLEVVLAAVSLALLASGVVSAILGKSPMLKSTLRVLFGGWLAMAITYGLTKSVDSFGL